MATDGGHSLERIFLRLSDSCPLPVGWACLRQSEDRSNILFAHVTVDEHLKVQCDRTILLTPMMTEKSSCLVQVTFSESSSSSPSNSTSLLIRDLTDVSNLLRVSGKIETPTSKKVAKKSTGLPSSPSGMKRDCAVELTPFDSPLAKRAKSPSPIQDICIQDGPPVTIEPVTMASSSETSANPFVNSAPPFKSTPSSQAPSSFNPSLFQNTSQASSNSDKFKFAADKERPYKCPQCDKTFVRGNHLKDHMRLHVGETYECPVCQYQCILQTKFTHHLTSHNNRGPFPCSHCEKSFERAHDLARHLPVDHKVDTGFRLSHFKNNFSPAQFKDKSALPPSLLSIAGRNSYSSQLPTSSLPLSTRTFPPRPSIPDLPAISAAPVNITDFGNGSFEDMQRLMKLYGDSDQDDDSVIPLDDDGDEQFSRVKSLDDEFGDDAILVE